MDDMARDLPLSNRPRRDETAVTANFTTHRGTVLLEIAGMLDELSPEEWNAPALRAGWSVRDVVGELVWLAGSSSRQRAATVARRAFSDRSGLAAASDALVREHTDRTPANLVEAVRSLAVDDLASRGWHRVSALAPAVVAAFELAAATGRPTVVDPIASGAVALARSLSAPMPMRAVVTARTLVAADADWRVGRGPELEGTAAGIVLFLYGRASLTPSVNR